MTFVDANGREWEVFDFSVIAGRVTQFPIGSSGAAYRGFVPVDRGARRTFMFMGAKVDRSPDPANLAAQLQASRLYWKDDPETARVAREAGLKTAKPERVDGGP